MERLKPDAVDSEEFLRLEEAGVEQTALLTMWLRETNDIQRARKIRAAIVHMCRNQYSYRKEEELYE